MKRAKRNMRHLFFAMIATVFLFRGGITAEAIVSNKQELVLGKITSVALNIPPFLPHLPTTTFLTFKLLTSASNFFLPTPSFAAPFAPGDTLDPNCSPGDVDCYVEIPPAGSDGYIQYNNGGSFGAESNLFWDDDNNYLGINDATPSYALDVTGVIQATSGFRTNSETITDFSQVLDW